MIESIETIRKRVNSTYNNKDADTALRLWVYSIIDDILEDPSMIYVDEGEAVYSYEAFEKYKQRL